MWFMNREITYVKHRQKWTFIIYQRPINREVFGKIEKNAKFYIDKDKKIIHDFFPCCVVDNEYLTEDYYFCKQWEDVGGDVYADLQINIRHEGWHSYPGNPLRSMRTS